MPMSLLLRFALALLIVAGCAEMLPREAVHMYVVGLDPLPGQGMEVRFNLKLRVQNPNETPINYDGLALELQLNGKPFATGVSDHKGTVPRFGESVITVPVTVSAFSALRHALALPSLDNVPYAVSGKLSGGAFGWSTFSETGTLSLPGFGKAD